MVHIYELNIVHLVHAMFWVYPEHSLSPNHKDSTSINPDFTNEETEIQGFMWLSKVLKIISDTVGMDPHVCHTRGAGFWTQSLTWGHLSFIASFTDPSQHLWACWPFLWLTDNQVVPQSCLLFSYWDGKKRRVSQRKGAVVVTRSHSALYQVFYTNHIFRLW
jgi:hypothetical protein